MPNYEIDRLARGRGFGVYTTQSILSNVNALRSKLLFYYVPQFPLDAARIEELLNTDGALDHIRALRDMDYNCFTTITAAVFRLDNINASRGVCIHARFHGIIVPKAQRSVSSAYEWHSIDNAWQFPLDRLTVAECHSLRAWTELAQEWRRKSVMIGRTVTAFMQAATCTYDYSVTWPSLASLTPWTAERREWGNRFEDKPRSPQNYDLRLKGLVPDLARRIEACDFLLIKAKLLPERERPGLDFRIWQWEPKPSDPEWMR